MTRKILYGGSWSFGAGGCRASLRLNFGPDNRNYDFGFRLTKKLKS
jgi:formylglycine-generating enzyme required for sulfatase activity